MTHKLTRSLLCSTALLTAMSAQSTIKTYGTGTAGTGGLTPAIWASTTPYPGSTDFAITIEDGLGAAAATGFLSFAPLDASVFGIDFLVDLSVTLSIGNVVLSSAGEGEFPIALPAMTSLVDVPLYVQGFVLDLGSSAMIPVATTEGLELRIKIGPPLLLTTHSVGGSTDPQSAIDLTAGTVMDFGAANVDNARDVTITRDGSIACYAASIADSVEFFDATTFPPTHLSSYDASLTAGRPSSIEQSPDRLFLFVVNNGPAGTTPELELLFGDPNDPQFGQSFPIPPIQLSAANDTLEIVFKPDGTRAYLAVLGFINPASVIEIDTDTTSPTFFTVLNARIYSGFVWSATANDNFVYAASGGFGAPLLISILDAGTFQPIDLDPGAPGVQSLGGELSIPPTPVDPMTTNLVVGPRGRFLYTANGGSISRIDVDFGSAAFGTVLTVTGGQGSSDGAFGLAITDAGDKLYVGYTQADEVVEFDTATMTRLRSWNVAAQPMEMAVR